jgi:hypothetical protein
VQVDAVCCVSGELQMHDGSGSGCGRALRGYQRAAIEQWITLNKGNTKSPVAGGRLAHHELLTNSTLCKTIDEVVEAELARVRAGLAE